MIIRLICLCGLLLLTQAEAAFAETPSPRLACSLFSWKNVVRFESLSAMRPEVVRMLLDRLGSQANAKTRSNLMAERDAIWADGATPDSPLPSRRFLYGLRFGNRWIVWYERGGKTRSSHLVIYDFLPATPAPILVGHLTTGMNDLCPVTRTLLNARILVRGGLDNGTW
jgi:hypothetical protein